jgi:hypothetical protein
MATIKDGGKFLLLGLMTEALQIKFTEDRLTDKKVYYICR